MNLNSFNSEQRKAIESDIKNIIVAAGAGSGKTQVLSNRVVYNLVNHNINIDEILVLTFTELAASEMKSRIKENLIKENNPRLNKMLPYVDSAHIQTYDSYFLFLVKKYKERLGFENDIKIISKDILEVQKRKLIKEKLNKLYIEKNEKIIKVLRAYYKKNDNSIENFILDLTNEVLYKDEETFIENYKEKFLKKDFFEHIINQSFNNIKMYAKEALSFLSKCENEKLRTNLEGFYSPLNEATSLKEMCDFLSKDYVFDKSRLKSETDKTIKDTYITEVAKKIIIKQFKNFEVDTFLNTDYRNMCEFVPYFLHIAFEINKELEKYKNYKLSYTFDDVKHFALKLLKENEDIRNEIKFKTKVILIDEYQDTSPIEEEFLNLIENNNVFLVGDIKQCVYKFRGSDPFIFRTLIEKFDKDDDSKSEVIRMNKNYRSMNNVIKYVNYVFRDAMRMDEGGIDYNENEKLIPHYEKDVLKTNDNTNDDSGFEYLNIVKLPDKTAKENEICAIAADIIRRIKNKELVFHKTDEGLKKEPIRFSDIVILMRTSAQFDDYVKIFSSEEYKISIVKIGDDEFLEDEALKPLVSLFRIINELQSKDLVKNDIKKVNIKKLFVSIARSYLYQYDDKKIYDLLKDDYYENDDLYKGFKEFSQKIDGFSIHKTFVTVLEEYDILNKIISLDTNQISVSSKIELLKEKTIQMDELGYTLEDFINYIDDIQNYGLKIESKLTNTVENAVRIMTIHASKGLEFPVVYFSNIYKDPMGEDRRNKNLITKDYGYWLEDLASGNTGKPNKFIKTFLDLNNVDRDEEVRIYYVALTRVKEKGIFLVNPITPMIVENIDESIKGLYRCIVNHQSLLKQAPDPDFNLKLEEENFETYEIISNFEYKENKIEFNKLFDVSFKASKNLKDGTSDFILNEGTHYHLLMELVDFYSKDTSFIKNEKEKEIIDNVLKNPIFNDVNDARVYKEYSFYDSESKINGIIDLLLVYKDHAIIIDYKLKNISDDAYIRQLEIYKNYVTKVFNLETSCYLLSLKDNIVKKII